MEPHERPDDLKGSIENDQSIIPDFEIDTLARCLLPKIRAYFESPEGQSAFKDWQRQQNT